MTRGDYIEAAQMFRAAAKVAAAGGDAKAASLWWWAARQGIAYARRKTVSGKKNMTPPLFRQGCFLSIILCIFTG